MTQCCRERGRLQIFKSSPKAHIKTFPLEVVWIYLFEAKAFISYTECVYFLLPLLNWTPNYRRGRWENAHMKYFCNDYAVWKELTPIQKMRAWVILESNDKWPVLLIRTRGTRYLVSVVPHGPLVKMFSSRWPEFNSQYGKRLVGCSRA